MNDEPDYLSGIIFHGDINYTISNNILTLNNQYHHQKYILQKMPKLFNHYQAHNYLILDVEIELLILNLTNLSVLYRSYKNSYPMVSVYYLSGWICVANYNTVRIFGRRIYEKGFYEATCLFIENGDIRNAEISPKNIFVYVGKNKNKIIYDNSKIINEKINFENTFERSFKRGNPKFKDLSQDTIDEIKKYLK